MTSWGLAIVSNTGDLEKKLWEAADELRANSKLRSSEYSAPVLGLVFLKWADFKFSHAKDKLEQKTSERGSRRREATKTDYQAQGVMYLVEQARFSYLVRLPEGAALLYVAGKTVNSEVHLTEPYCLGHLVLTIDAYPRKIGLALLQKSGTLDKHTPRNSHVQHRLHAEHIPV